jgi:uncharacterized protein YggT (Ycf19 family)
MTGMTNPNPNPYPGQTPGVPFGTPPASTPSATVQQYEEIATEAEKSPVPLVIKICRAIVWVFYAVVLINTILLTMAFLLELFGANPEAGFVDWVYRSTERAMRPFQEIFPPIEISDHSVLDTSLLFAIVIYLVLVVSLHALLNWLQRKLIEQDTKMRQARATADAVALEEETRIAAAQAVARQEAARQQAMRQEAARYEAARQEAARQTAAAQAAAAAAGASQAAAQSAAYSAAQSIGQSAAAGYQPAPPPAAPYGGTPGTGSVEPPAAGAAPGQPPAPPGY